MGTKLAPARARRTAAGTVLLVVVVTAVAIAADPGHGGGSERDGGFLHGRLATWRAAAETVADRPLQGSGADSFLPASARHQRSGPVAFAHDLPLELTVELGAAGALLALALYAAAIRAAWRARASAAGRLLGPAALAFLAASLVDWPWHLAGSGAVFATALGALSAASGRAASLPSPQIATETGDRMNRRRALAATGVLAIVLAGCGGSSNKQLSYSGFISKADALCREGQTKGNQASSASEAGKIIDTYVKRFKKLTPPDKLKPEYDEFVSISEQQVKALQAGDVQKANALNARSNEVASKMGTAGCVSQ